MTRRRAKKRGRPGFVEFPKCKYHADHKVVVVDNPEDEAKLGEGWQDVPVERKNRILR
jgi:hypothetical protein